MIDAIQKTSTIHSYSGGGTGANSIDGDWNTAQTHNTRSHKGPNSEDLYSTHEFTSNYYVEEIKFRVSTSSNAAACQYGSWANNAWEMAYWDIDLASWVTFTGASGSGASANPVYLTKDDFGKIKTNKVRLHGQAAAGTSCTGGDTGQETDAYVSLFEVQCWIKPKAYSYII